MITLNDIGALIVGFGFLLGIMVWSISTDILNMGKTLARIEQALKEKK